MDLNLFGKQEEQELIKRKTFYDEVKEIIDGLKLSEEEKDRKKIQDKHNKEEKKILMNLIKKKIMKTIMI